MAANQGEGQNDPHRREPGQRRPMCGVCTKPLPLCLCGRLRRPPLDTAVGVTILQHVMEAGHPLNSTRVAILGLRNLAVAQVGDVNHRASFHLRTRDAGAAASGCRHAAAAGNRDHSDAPGKSHVLEGDGFGDVTGGPAGPGQCEGERLDSAICSDSISGELGRAISCARCDYGTKGINASSDLSVKDANLGGSSDIGGEILDFVDIPDRIGCDLDGEVCGFKSDLGGGDDFGFQNMNRNGYCSDSERPDSPINQVGNSVNGIHGENHNNIDKVNGNFPHHSVENASEFQMSAAQNCNGICRENVGTGAAIGQGWTVKNMDKCSITYTEKELKIDIERGVKPKIRWLSSGPLGQSAVSNGFTVTKIQMKKSKLTGEVSVFKEFSVTVPPKSALLFPCQRAISIDASDCQVQHLIVLDGTWAKAQRMYHENPWLQLLPHVKLESDGVSLYSEVRHEPRAGCLSTIESIIVAMRKLGVDAKGLDDLLDVFKSMIADQRRCKDENWKQKLESKT